ncbi:hypothetical protein [Deinococcus sonorensis]|uniref:Uncharacterized protein n=2 Tax=Deinococcus sonorensis TaxID=309891 RepID=A0AAU7U6J6_9DEIO
MGRAPTPASEDGQSGRGSAWAVRHWPYEQVWLDLEQGVVVATGGGGHVAGLLVTTVPLGAP